MSTKRFSMTKSLNGIFALILIVTGILAGSCSGGKRTANNISLSTIDIDTIKPLFKDSVSPVYSYKISIEYLKDFENKTVLNKINNLIIGYIFGDRYTGKTLDTAITKNIESCFAEYTELADDFSEEETISAVLNYEKSIKSEISCNINNVLSMHSDVYHYTGGAHGMFSSTCMSVDLNTGNPVYYEDIFTDNSFNDIAELIINQIAINLGVENPALLNESGFFSAEEIKPTENFEILEDGILWVYNPYEIACYAVGQVNVLISWEQLAPYILENSIARSFF